jgi:methylthioribose-1-phosphate isomerase
VRLAGDAVELLDQRLLPGEERYLRLESAEEVARAIEDMAVRGAPAIGVTAAMAIAVELAHAPDAGLRNALDRATARLARTDPPQSIWPGRSAHDARTAAESPPTRRRRRATRALAQRVHDRISRLSRDR